ncbi:secretin N-terminal domain-containing protein [Rhodoferax sp.]|uniref:secretin N-terminal domain-containing protein n=1 Tax=Rhodoferax sp. TaxID=50421 RepID=UPI00283EDE04|nr:secretin N-terminal domain-containing protein [Rhodoferax sp.]MDR3370379.1 secretin N-terminal domain-containing protein [Rhodoferax sp.]
MKTEELAMTECLLNIRHDPLYLEIGKQLARVGLVIAALAIGGCAAERPLRTPSVSDAIRAEVPMPAAPVAAASAPVPARIADALVEPAPPPVALPPEPRIDLLVNNAPARDVFLAMVADTRYSMLMHPDVSGTLSVTLRGVTIAEALEAIRDVYGYDFKIDGRRITIFAPTLQTRIFTINYPNSQRSGNSDLRVSSGSEGRSSGTSSSGNTSGGGTTTGSIQAESSRVTTNSKTDYWSELTNAVKGLVGPGEGRSVVTSPQAGIMAVRAMPEELRQVSKFLKAAQISVQRQVMLEAKIVQVSLSDGYQSGIDWSALKNSGNSTGAIGVLSGNSTSNTLISGVQSNLPGFVASTTGLLANGVALPTAGAGLFGLAFATEGFQAVLGFLETRGDVQILSSPRIATLNNQKAVLKVGTDDFFVTGVTGGSNSAGTTTTNSTTTLPDITLTPFFSGISLDVTPQIDDGDTITLHVHPSVTTVTEKTREVDLGTVGNYRFPLASSEVNESDTLVRIQDGKIVAIGGLMQMESNRSSSGLPGSSNTMFSSLLGNKANTGSKKELVVLIKPTIIRNQEDWDDQNRRSRAALDDMDAARARVIRMDGQVVQHPVQ